MKKTYQMFLALVAMLLLGVTNVSAEEKSLQDVPFWQHEAGLWGLNAPKNTQATPLWVVGESTGQPYGDSSVNNWADLSGYDKLVITYTEGTPRVMMNRDQDEGQYNANEAESHLIEYPKCASSWAGKYFVVSNGEEEGVKILTVDLKAIVNDKGFAQLNAIKGADWANVTIQSMVVTFKGKEKQVGWINILSNSDLEGEDVSSFVTALHANEGDGSVTYPAVIQDGVGVDGSRGISLKSDADAPQTWTTQLFVYLPEVLPAGTQWRFSMDAVANPQAEVDVAGHAQPRAWQCGGADISSDFANPLTFNSDWTKIEAKGTISESLFGKGFQSICFDLNKDKETATQYYFDNIKFEIYKYGTVAEFFTEFVKVDFGFETNIPELCKAAGKSRVLFPVENAKVLANGREVKIVSVEGFADGRFYIFLEEALEETDEVRVIYNNAAGDLQLVYAGGADAGKVIPNVDEIADYNEDVAEGEDVFSYAMLPPSIVSAYPEDGSFNIKNDLKEFKVKFDKLAQADKIKATLDGAALTVSPNEGLVTEIILKYAGADMTNGLHAIRISEVYPENDALELATDTTYQFSVGPTDPSDQPFDLIPISYFNECANNGIPEGFKVYADGMEERTPGNTYGSNARLFSDFATGGDFTHALYFRRNYVTYGKNDDTHVLNMEAGKTYTLTFNAARWKASGEYMKVVILNADGEEQFAQTYACNPDVNGSKAAVKNSTAAKIEFTPTTSGNYELRFVVATNADGAEAGDDGMREMMVANVKFSYIPSTYGIVEMMAVQEALDKAKKIQETFADERYDGEAQSTLNSTIITVETNMNNYTSPSECYEAVDALGQWSEALTNHANLCNNYDQLIKEGSDVVRQNENPSNTGIPTKFVKLELFGQLKAVVDKYHGVSELVNDGTDEEPNWQKHYTFDILKEDAQLTAAVAELNDIVNTTSKLFTTGASQRNTTGVAALVERLRLGAEALKVLEPEDETIQVALDALDDDDSIAETLMNKTTVSIYGKLKDGQDIFHATAVDPETLEETTVDKTYDMTVFVKNPNMYSREYSTEVPGWNIIAGNPVAWSSWDGNVTHGTKTPYVEDCCIYLQWHAACNVEQTITNLPKGVYSIYFNANDNSGESDGTYVYVKKSDTPAVEEGAELDPETNYAGYAPVNNSGWDRTISDITVLDGQLTLGFVSGTVSQPFLEYVRITMTGKAEGVDYAEEYEKASGIEIVEVNNKVQNGVIYNLSGQKVSNSFKGIVIMNGKKFVVK